MRKASEIIVRDATSGDALSMSVFMTALSQEGLDTVSARPPSTADEQRDFVAAVQRAGGALFLSIEGDAVVGLLDLWPGQKPYN